MNSTIKFIPVLLAIISSCSNDGPEHGCFQEEARDVVATITEVKGTIDGVSCDKFIIEPDNKNESRPLGLYDPCNLSSEFEIDGTKVVFSGFVYESFENEDICADFFEITEIRFINP
ncbi:hypothetical protein MAR621_03008 [Maribacter dokdonensis]|uniref:hypothetical protein n=1 Tax=Maribacter dokdonensis TaxID=320912 RepID=UPI001B08EFC4|nr:hypothetical protein [Maribacter dokdonensis]CAG2532814.1 hypothetical protein MAR621_03008 [Maribacter dokdonensis]